MPLIALPIITLLLAALLPAAPLQATEPLQQRLEGLISEHNIAGASAAVYRDGVVESAAAGVINVATGAEMTGDTILHVGSITKVVNATLVMQLVDEGVLDLDAPLQQYLPDFSMPDDAAASTITVRMLINHTNGIDGEILPDYGPDQERIADAYDRARRLDFNFPPGTETSYSNTGTMLAGYLAQTVTGMSWYDLVKERIYGPLELQHAAVLPSDALLQRASVGHYPIGADGALQRTSQMFLPLSFAPAGATQMMSATALMRFGIAHLNDGVGDNGARILSAESARAMREPNAEHQNHTGHACLGWHRRPDGLYHHGGGGPGILSYLFLHPDSRTVIAVLTNTVNGAGLIAAFVEPIFADIGLEPMDAATKRLHARVRPRAVDPSAYTGMFGDVAQEFRVEANEAGDGLTVASRAKHAFYVDVATTEWGPAVPLAPAADHEFVRQSAGGAPVGGGITFRYPNDSGIMQYVAIGTRIYRRRD